MVSEFCADCLVNPDSHSSVYICNTHTGRRPLGNPRTTKPTTQPPQRATLTLNTSATRRAAEHAIYLRHLRRASASMGLRSLPS